MISKIFQLIKIQYLNILLVIASFGLSATFFRFKSYFSLREIFLLPDNKNFIYGDSLLEFFNFHLLQFGINSESFYSIVFILLFSGGLIVTYFAFYRFIKLIIQIREINYEDGVNFFAVKITTKLIIFLFSIFIIYNPITLKFFLLGSIAEIIAYFSLPILFSILIGWVSELSQISIFQDIKNSQKLYFPTLITSMRSAFFISIFLLISLVLNLSFTYIVALGGIVGMAFLFVVIFDFRKVYFYRPSIYIEEARKYKLIGGNLIIKYLAYPLLIFLPSVFTYLIYQINPNFRDNSDFAININNYNFFKNATSGEIRLGDWYNINWSIFNEVNLLEKLLGSTAKFSVFFNQYIHWIIILSFLVLIINWIISIFKSSGVLLYINTLIVTIGTIISLGYLSTYLVNFKIFNQFYTVNHNHLYIIIAMIIFIMSVLSVLDILKNFAKWHIQLNLIFIIILLFLVTFNILPFTQVNQIVNYTTLNSAYTQLNQKCTNKNLVLELPKQAFVKDYKTEKIIKNPLNYLSNCKLVNIDSVQIELDVIIGLGGNLSKEKTMEWLAKLKSEKVSFLVLNISNNNLTTLYNQINLIKAPMIIQDELITYEVEL